MIILLNYLDIIEQRAPYHPHSRQSWLRLGLYKINDLFQEQFDNGHGRRGKKHSLYFSASDFSPAFSREKGRKLSPDMIARLQRNKFNQQCAADGRA
jgi:hypothetical protein